MRTILVLAIALVLVLVACSEDGDQTANGTPNGDTPSPTEPSALGEPSERCEDASAIAGGIAEGLTVEGGGVLRNAQAIKSKDFENVYFIAAEIDGPGMEGDGEVGLWASNSLEPGGGLIFAVDGLAKEFSDWGHGDSTDAEITASDEGAEEAKECVSTAQS